MKLSLTIWYAMKDKSTKGAEEGRAEKRATVMLKYGW